MWLLVDSFNGGSFILSPATYRASFLINELFSFITEKERDELHLLQLIA